MGNKLRKPRITIGKIIIVIVLAASAALCLLPILNMVAISFSETSIAASGKVFFWPKNFTLASYKKLISEKAFGRAFAISVMRVIVGTTMAMAVTIVSGYALSKEVSQFRQRDIFMWLAVFSMLFSGGLIPSYIVNKNLGLIDSFWVLVLPSCLSVYNCILLMNFFRGVPRELEEAAAIDGAGPWRTMLRIYLPISLPSLATITLFTVVGHWNDFFTGQVYINDKSLWPLQTYIQQLVVQIDYASFLNPEELIERMKVSNMTFNAAKIVVSMVPILCIYPFLQRYFVHGLVMGSVKE